MFLNMFTIILKNFLIIFLETFRNISVSYPKYYEWLNCQNFPKYFSKMSDAFLEIFQDLSRNFLKWFLKFSNIILRIFRNIYRKFSNYFWKLFSEIFQNISRNFPKYFSKCYETILKILHNNYRNFRKLLKFFNIILKISAIFLVTSRNISEIFWDNFRNDLVLKMFEILINFQNFPKHFSKFYEMNRKILCNNRQTCPKFVFAKTVNRVLSYGFGGDYKTLL